MRLSVVLATKNEEANIARCLESVKPIASEIILYDEYSTDKTRDIAKQFKAKVLKYRHKTNFHETKQKAIDRAKGNWILQLDADEVVTPELADEIRNVISFTKQEALDYESKIKFTHVLKWGLFLRHQSLVESREGYLGTLDSEITAYFIPRRNIFLGKPLIHGGVYPDGVIRLFKRGHAWLPGKSVHELMHVKGKVSWLIHDLDHYDSPTLQRYLARNKRYVDLLSQDIAEENQSDSVIRLLDYLIIKPVTEFFSLYFRHKAVMDGYRGFIWSFFSALRFPRAYLEYLNGK